MKQCMVEDLQYASGIESLLSYQFFILFVKPSSTFSVDEHICRMKCHSTEFQQCDGELRRNVSISKQL